MSSESDYVIDALRRLTDGSLTFRVEEDRWAVAAAYDLDGRLIMHAWPKWEMAEYLDQAQEVAEAGVRSLLAKGNAKRPEVR